MYLIAVIPTLNLHMISSNINHVEAIIVLNKNNNELVSMLLKPFIRIE